jgi:hypothetical protein
MLHYTLIIMLSTNMIVVFIYKSSEVNIFLIYDKNKYLSLFLWTSVAELEHKLLQIWYTASLNGKTFMLSWDSLAVYIVL